MPTEISAVNCALLLIAVAAVLLTHTAVLLISVVYELIVELWDTRDYHSS